MGQSELKIKFTVNTMFHNVNRFPLNFTMQGMLSQDSYSKIWSYTAHVLVPNTGIFGTIAFQQCTYIYYDFCSLYIPKVVGQIGLSKQCRPRSDAAFCSI